MVPNAPQFANFSGASPAGQTVEVDLGVDWRAAEPWTACPCSTAAAVVGLGGVIDGGQDPVVGHRWLAQLHGP